MCFPHRFQLHLRATRVDRRQPRCSSHITKLLFLKSQAQVNPKTRRPARQVPKLVLNSRDLFQHEAWAKLPMSLKICEGCHLREPLVTLLPVQSPAWKPGSQAGLPFTEAPLNTKALALNAPSCSGDSFACPECASRNRCDRWLQQGYCLPAPWWQLEMWLSKAFEVRICPAFRSMLRISSFGSSTALIQ